MNSLSAHIDSSLRQRGLLRRGERVLVAVSGGVDSMALLHLLHSLAGQYGWKLAVAHYNHQLRGRASDADAQLVQRTAKSLGLSVIIERGNVKALAERSGLSLEMAARKLRHEFLARTAAKMRAQTIVLAHHADDQVELFFLRLLRGSGGEGIAGMKWRNPSPANPKIELIRPLLDVPKADLEAFAREQKIKFRNDATNTTLDIRRNRIRHELLPLLKRHYQPATERTVLRAMDIVGAEAEFVTAAARQWLKRRTPFARLDIAVQRRCLQLQLQRLNLPADFDVIEELRCSAHVTINLGPSLSVQRDRAGLVLLHTHHQPDFDATELHINLGRAKKANFDGLTCHWRVTIIGNKRPAAVKQREYFDAGKVGPRITLRHWRPGDRFQPIGMARPVKLQDWFTNQKIPRAQRHELVLATATNGEIFWVQGCRISENFKLTAATRQRLEWCWSQT